jgi:pimeloyl-ACP methyl ester carboxylesterase
MQRIRRRVKLNGLTIEVVRFPVESLKAPILMLHEGLGSVASWRDFPERLAKRTGRTVVAYSRYGYGRSESLAGPRGVRYLHEEAEVALPELIAALGLDSPVLFGHSDGASIALIYAGRHPDAVTALVLEAPHVFVEPISVESIARVRAAAPDFIARIARYHDDPAGAFWGWNDIWLHPGFRTWDIRGYLPSITAPTLLVQGRDDEYATLAHVDAITAAVPNAARLIFEASGHSPHRTRPVEVLETTAAFLSTCS